MKKGDIFWGRKNDSNSEHLLHPIVFMEDVNDVQKQDKIKAVIISTKAANGSLVENVEMNRYHFEQMNSKKRYYKIRVNRKKKAFLVCFGFLKIPMSLHVHESGRLTSKGIKFVEETLAKKNIKKYEYVPYTIKEYNEYFKKKKSNKSRKSNK